MVFPHPDYITVIKETQEKIRDWRSPFHDINEKGGHLFTACYSPDMLYS
jgi:hypothetical protein